MRWAQAKYQHCLLEDAIGEAARKYLGGRKLSGKTVRDFGLGFAPLAGDWLVKLRRRRAASPTEVLVEVGLIAARARQAAGFYDRFRDRVMFPIRDVRGQTVGFGGRIMPESPYAARGPEILQLRGNAALLQERPALRPRPGPAAGARRPATSRSWRATRT